MKKDATMFEAELSTPTLQDFLDAASGNDVTYTLEERAIPEVFFKHGPDKLFTSSSASLAQKDTTAPTLQDFLELADKSLWLDGGFFKEYMRDTVRQSALNLHIPVVNHFTPSYVSEKPIYDLNRAGLSMSSSSKKLVRDRLVQSPCGTKTELQDAYSARDLCVNSKWVDITHLLCAACHGKSIGATDSCWNCDNVGYTEDV